MKAIRTSFRLRRAMLVRRRWSIVWLLSGAALLGTPNSTADEKVALPDKISADKSTVRLAELGSSDGISTASGGAAQIEVSAEFEKSTRFESTRGIELSLNFTNQSEDDVSLLEPSEFVLIVVLNEEGWPVSLPATPPAALICNDSGSQSVPDGGERAFEVVGVSREGSHGGEHTHIKSVPIAAGEGHRTTLRVTRVLADPEGYAAQMRQNRNRAPDAPALPSPKATLIGPGKYRVKVWVGLRSATDDSRQVVQSDWLPVELR